MLNLATEKFFIATEKYWVLRMDKWNLGTLGRGVGLWKMHGFEHERK